MLNSVLVSPIWLVRLCRNLIVVSFLVDDLAGLFDTSACILMDVLQLLSTFIWGRKNSGFYRRLLGPVSDHVLINRASKERALHQVIKRSHLIDCRAADSDY